MATFPTLSVNPSAPDWKEGRVSDPTLKQETDGGYSVTGARFTRRPPKKYHVKIEPLTAAQKASLEEFEEEVQIGAGMFDWTNPNTSAVVDARLAGPIEYRFYKEVPGLWTVEFDIEEV